MIHKKILPVEKMMELENWIDSLPEDVICYLNDNNKGLPEKLGLKVEYVDENMIDPDVEAELCPTDDLEYNGLIRVGKKQKNLLFPYMHEIIHYLKDVGINNRVEQTFTRKVSGKTETLDEQHINYLTASAGMRYQDIKRQLEKYDQSKPKMDELDFINSLCEKYNQDQVAVKRRIVEVRKLRRHRSRFG